MEWSQSPKVFYKYIQEQEKTCSFLFAYDYIGQYFGKEKFPTLEGKKRGGYLVL